MSEWYGINYPFNGGIQNVLSKQIGVRVVQNDILQLLYTSPGERAYRPDFGVGILNYLYDQLDDTTISDLRRRITNQMGIHEPRTEIQQLNLNKDSDNSKLKLLMVCNLVQSPDEIFEINLDLPIFGENNV